MNGRYVFDQYLSLKAHFSSKSYDYYKYNGEIKSSEKYDTRNDKLIFERIAKSYRSIDMPGVLVSQFIDNPSFWIGDFNKSIYIDWKRRTDSLDYIFKQDLSKIFENINTQKEFKNIFIYPKGQHPKIFQMLLNGDITIETFSILNALFPFFHILDKNIDIPIVWNKKKKIAQKYVTFLKFNEKEYKRLLKEKLADLSE